MMSSEQWKVLHAKLSMYERMFENSALEYDWKDATVDLADILSRLLGGSELGRMIAEDPDLKNWKDLHVAKQYRIRASHPNEILDVPARPSNDEWKHAAKVLFDACQIVSLRTQREKFRGEYAGAGAAMLRVVQFVATGALVAPTAAILASVVEQTTGDDHEVAVRLMQTFEGIAGGKISKKDLEKRLPEIVADSVRVMCMWPLESHKRIAPGVADSALASSVAESVAQMVTAVMMKSKDLHAAGAKPWDEDAWFDWFLNEQLSDEMKKRGSTMQNMLATGGEILRSQVRRNDTMQGTVEKPRRRRDFVNVYGDDGKRYFMHRNDCSDELRAILWSDAKSSQPYKPPRISFRVGAAPPGRLPVARQAVLVKSHAA